MNDVKMAVHLCGVRGDSSLDFKHTSSLSLALCSVPFERARPRRRAFHMQKQKGEGKLGLVEECRIGILPVCPAPVATGPSQNNAKACDQTENKQVPSYNRTKDWAVYELKNMVR